MAEHGRSDQFHPSAWGNAISAVPIRSENPFRFMNVQGPAAAIRPIDIMVNNIKNTKNPSDANFSLALINNSFTHSVRSLLTKRS